MGINPVHGRVGHRLQTYCLRTVPSRPPLGLRSMSCHGADDPDRYVDPYGDDRQRLTAALHTCDRCAGRGPTASHPLGRFYVGLRAQLGQALLLPRFDFGDLADRDEKVRAAQPSNRSAQIERNRTICVRTERASLRPGTAVVLSGDGDASEPLFSLTG